MSNLLGFEELWDKCSLELQKCFDDDTFKTWIKPIVPKDLKDNRLSLEVPNNFFYEWVSDHYSDIITNALNKVSGNNIKLVYCVRKIDIEQKRNSISANRRIINNHLSFIKKNFADIDDISGLNPKYTFDNFIEGACNQLAKSTAESIAKIPINNPFSPLMIHSDVGLGKTHLLHAIGNKIKNDFKDKIVVFIPTTVFIEQFINSIRSNDPQEFSRFYRDVDVLLLDDVQFLKDKIKTQENLYFIFNQFYQMGKPIVLTSDKPPNKLEGLQTRLVSRFKWGVTADINTPDLETKIAILESKFANKYNIPKPVLEYIAQRVNSNIREMEGIMITAIANISSYHDIDIAFIKKIINKIASNDLVVDKIIDTVSAYFMISIEDMLGKNRHKDISLARQIAMYIAKKCTECPLKTIGSLFGGRDHSTVIHAINTIELLSRNDKKIKNTINILNKEIESKINRKVKVF